MSLRLSGWCLLLIAAGLAATACQGESRQQRIDQGEVVLNLGADPRTLDPSLATDVASTRAILAFQRGLTVLDDQGLPHPELAESWTISPDGLTYDFKLRPAKWSNGQPVTASDFVYAWTRRMLNPAFAAEYAYQLFYLRGAKSYYENPSLSAQSVGVQAVAPDHLRVELTSPTPFFLTLAAHPSYFPICQATDQANPDWAKRPETYVGCGPFLLDSFQPGFEIVAIKNPGYWNATHVAIKRLTLRIIEKESTALIAFENGEIDGSDSVPRPELDALRKEPYLRFSPQYATYYLYLNCQHPPLNDARVRRALGLAVDRKAIVTSVTRAGEQPAFSMVPPALFNTNEAHAQIAQVLQETWRRELGIGIEILNQEFKVTIDMRREGRFDIARAGWVADFADPINFLETLDSKSENNDSHWADAHYDRLREEARRETDPVRREAILRQADLYLVQQMPIIPIYYYTNPYLADPRLEGYSLNPMGMFDPARLAWKTAGAE